MKEEVRLPKSDPNRRHSAYSPLRCALLPLVQLNAQELHSQQHVKDLTEVILPSGSRMCSPSMVPVCEMAGPGPGTVGAVPLQRSLRASVHLWVCTCACVHFR